MKRSRTDAGAPVVRRPVVSLAALELREALRFELDHLADPSARIEIWEQPRSDWVCVLGGDTAFGIEGRDFDAACILCKYPGPLRQVGEIYGHFGDRFDRLIYAAARYFNDAFVLIERQTLGLAIMQRLLLEYRYQWIYYERRQEQRHRKPTDLLGHPHTDNDLLLWHFRRAFLDRSILLRSRMLLAQMSRLQFRESTPLPTGDRREDRDLKVHLPGGGSPDLVMAAAYALFASTQVEHYPKPAPEIIPGTLGDLLGHGSTFDPEPNRSNSWIRKRAR